MIRAAIVGIGWWGRTLVNAVQGRSAAFRFTAGHTRTRAAAEEFCAEHGIALQDDLDAILADPAIDAVVFATPHSHHGKQVERAAAAGKHVFMEKPFTLDVASAEAALAAAARARIVLGVAYPRRFHPAVAELQARLADGRLGTVSHCASEQTAPAGLSMRADFWRSDPREAPAGAMTASGVHNVDLLIHLFGRIDEVYCTNLRRVMERLEDTTTVMFGLANGLSATLFCSLVTAVSYRFAVFGSKGCAELLTPEFQFRFSPTPEGPRTGRYAAAPPEIIEHKGFNTLRAELDAFAAAIEGGPPYPIPPEQILHGVAVFEAIVHSAARHQPVKVAR
ncbi:MAG TPA: Gfo/Idh/MocA family oxidoreductase [Stellaceae bacterium]|nr:Gfo/Idh/MocA family oxidoreductase [Stellaceae bacterium]